MSAQDTASGVKMGPVQIDRFHINDRRARARHIARRFSDHIRGSVLDVGCDRGWLDECLGRCDYTGLDQSGSPDVAIDLEAAGRLPFEDASFDCVVCADVLEHLDNLHAIFGELVRVARGRIIVSLPNAWSNARRPIERGKGSIGHYGLPLQPPESRHKWFFSLTEAREFLLDQADRRPIELLEMVITEKPRPWPVRAIRRMRYPVRDRYLNRYARAVWAVYGKNDQP